MSHLLATLIAAAGHTTTTADPTHTVTSAHSARAHGVNLHHIRFNPHALRHHLKSAPFDYLGLALGSLASWIGVPGPGEPLLVAAGLLASKGKLDLGTMLLVAWVTATVGGMAGWLIGMKAGRVLVTFPGPFRESRVRALDRGEKVFQRFAAAAVMLTPSWVSGINRVRPAVYLPINALAAAVWALGIGLGAYFIGPTVLDLVDDIGTYGLIALVVVAGAVMLGQRRRRRRRRSAQALSGEASGPPAPAEDGSS